MPVDPQLPRLGHGLLLLGGRKRLRLGHLFGHHRLEVGPFLRCLGEGGVDLGPQGCRVERRRKLGGGQLRGEHLFEESQASIWLIERLEHREEVLHIEQLERRHRQVADERQDVVADLVLVMNDRGRHEPANVDQPLLDG